MKNDGGAAFPCEQGHTPDGTWNQSFEPGMSLRDYFAAAALQGMLANPHVIGHDSRIGWQLVNCTADNIAATAYGHADAMLKAREEQS